MNNTPESKRLAKIELQLTPKHWAISLADEMRRYPSQADFLRAIAKGTYRQTPLLRPFYALAEQALARWPELSNLHVFREVQLSSNLRKKFQALKTLINEVNREIEATAGTNELKAALQLSRLQSVILRDALAHTDIAGTMSMESASATRLRLIAQLEDWADVTAMLMMETIAYKRAVQSIQEDYFEGHSILFNDIEQGFEMTIRTVRDSITMFNDYCKVGADLSDRKEDQSHCNDGMANATRFKSETSPSFDIENIEKRSEALAHSIVKKFVSDAKCKATFDILRETGKHEDYIWQQFQKEMGLKG